MKLDKSQREWAAFTQILQLLRCRVAQLSAVVFHNTTNTEWVKLCTFLILTCRLVGNYFRAARNKRRETCTRIFLVY